MKPVQVIMNRKAIIKHYNDMKERFKRISMRNAEVIDKAYDRECNYALAIFDNLGYLPIERVGQQWYICDYLEIFDNIDLPAY